MSNILLVSAEKSIGAQERESHRLFAMGHTVISATNYVALDHARSQRYTEVITQTIIPKQEINLVVFHDVEHLHAGISGQIFEAAHVQGIPVETMFSYTEERS